MNIDITRLKSGIDSQVEIDMLYSFDKEMLKKTDIISLDNISVKGYITSNSIDDYDLDVNVDGIMVLPSSLTLEPTDYKFSIKIGVVESDWKMLLESCESWGCNSAV